MESLLEQQTVQQARFDSRIESLSGSMSQLTGIVTGVQDQLRRAIRFSVEEARRERARRRALEEKVDSRFGELATAQLATERSLQRLIDSLQSHNGHDRTSLGTPSTLKRGIDIERAVEFLRQQEASLYAWSKAQQGRSDVQQAQFRADFEERQKL